MSINSFRSVFLELLSSCVVHILYFDDFLSTPQSLTPSQSVQKSPKWDMECCNLHLISQTLTPSPHCVCCIPAKPKNYYAKKKFLMNSQGTQAVSSGSINQRVKITSLFLCVKIFCFSIFTKLVSLVLL